MTTLTFETEVDCAPEKAWAWATSVAGISSELRPYMKMTAPKGVGNLEDVRIELGKPLFTSRILLFGWLPIDRYGVTLVEFDAGRGFVEQSKMRSMRLWRHERRIVAREGGSSIRDRLDFEPRWAPGLVAWFISKTFAHRHRVLKRALAKPT
jgi:ligand-binding SRPBCC domain-containing protein